MATGNVNVKVTQTIKGNKFSGKSRISQRTRMHFTFPANVTITIKRRPTKKQPTKTPQKPKRMKSND